jgi:hypothetical protein
VPQSSWFLTIVLGDGIWAVFTSPLWRFQWKIGSVHNVLEHKHGLDVMDNGFDLGKGVIWLNIRDCN